MMIIDIIIQMRLRAVPILLGLCCLLLPVLGKFPNHTRKEPCFADMYTFQHGTDAVQNARTKINCYLEKRLKGWALYYTRKRNHEGRIMYLNSCYKVKMHYMKRS